jgi:hypothetical protein
MITTSNAISSIWVHHALLRKDFNHLVHFPIPEDKSFLWGEVMVPSILDIYHLIYFK